jgi:hypothetical protein
MGSVARFRVVSPFPGVHVAVHKERFVTIPVGAEIETSEELQDPGVVTFTLNGYTILAFHRDILERTERIDERQFAIGA